jgi:hypothetical protein
VFLALLCCSQRFRARKIKEIFGAFFNRRLFLLDSTHSTHEKSVRLGQLTNFQKSRCPTSSPYSCRCRFHDPSSLAEQEELSRTKDATINFKEEEGIMLILFFIRRLAAASGNILVFTARSKQHPTTRHTFVVSLLLLFIVEDYGLSYPAMPPPLVAATGCPSSAAPACQQVSWHFDHRSSGTTSPAVVRLAATDAGLTWVVRFEQCSVMLEEENDDLASDPSPHQIPLLAAMISDLVAFSSVFLPVFFHCSYSAHGYGNEDDQGEGK